MPSIELVCVGQRAPVEMPAYPFAIVSEPEIVSHRGPAPLFARDFAALDGWIHHLGNPRCADPDYGGFFFAYELLSPASQGVERRRFLEFSAEVGPAVRDLIARLLLASPARRVVFTSDWQFGPRPARRYRPITSETFWRRHDRRKLRLNALYDIRAPIEP